MIPEDKFSKLKNVFRSVVNLCSIHLDGLIRDSDLSRLPHTTRLHTTLLSIFTHFSRSVNPDEVFDEYTINNSYLQFGHRGDYGIRNSNVHRRTTSEPQCSQVMFG